MFRVRRLRRNQSFVNTNIVKAGLSIEDSSGVPQVWRLRSESSRTSYNELSENFLVGREDFWGRQNDSFPTSNSRNRAPIVLAAGCACDVDTDCPPAVRIAINPVPVSPANWTNSRLLVLSPWSLLLNSICPLI